MTESKLKMLVTEAVALDREVVAKAERLKELKKQLTAEAVSRSDEHVNTDGGGTSWTAQGVDGCVVRVSFPGPSLKSSVDGEGKAIEKIRLLTGRFFNQLFQQAPKYKPVENFRDQAENHLGAATARRLIAACSSESSPRVSFETKESTEAA